ncbi:hypothetical protein WME91_49575 [Sorangium sp. So ce269]
MSRRERPSGQRLQRLGEHPTPAARSQWFRVVSAVLSNLELSDAPSEAIETIRGPLLKASDRAGKRYGGAPAGEGPSVEEPGEPAVDEAEETGAGDGEIVS